MAILNLSVTVPDAQLPRVQAAARAAFEDPNMTNNQMIERIRQETISMIKGMVQRYEKGLLVAAAEAPVALVDAT
jgi:hypothetical protein